MKKTRTRIIDSVLRLIVCACFAVSVPLTSSADPLFPGGDFRGEDHIGHDHSSEDLMDIRIDDALFTCADLSFSDLDETSATATNFDGVTMQFTGAEHGDFTGASFLETTCDGKFVPANLFEVDFDNATLTDALFTKARLSRADLSAATLDGATFDNADLTFSSASCLDDLTNPDPTILNCTSMVDTSFVGADLTGAQWVSVVYSGTDFSGATLTGAILALGETPCTGSQAPRDPEDPAPPPIRCLSFENAILNGANLTGSELDNANFTSAHLIQTRAFCLPTNIPEDPLDCSTFVSSNFTSANLTRADFTGAVLTASDFESAILTDAVFNGIDLNVPCVNENTSEEVCLSFSNAQLDGISMQNVDFGDIDFDLFGPIATVPDPDPSMACGPDRPNLRRASFTASVMDGVSFVCADLSGADFSSAQLPGVKFTGALLDGASFDGLVLDSACTGANAGDCIDFSGAIMRNVNLANTLLDDVEFVGTDLSGATFLEATLTAIDFTDAVLSGAMLDDLDLSEPCGTVIAEGGGAEDRCLIFTNAQLDGISLRNANFVNLPVDIFQDIADAPSSNKGDLRGSDVTGADLRLQILSNLDFSDAILADTLLSGTNFDGAIAQRADFSSSFADCVDDPDSTDPNDVLCISFDAAVLTDADLTAVNWTGANLTSANLDGVTLTCSDDGTNPICPTLFFSTLRDTSFADADLRGSFFDAADLSQPCPAPGDTGCIDFGDLDGDGDGARLNDSHWRFVDFGAVATGFFSDVAGLELKGVDFANARVSNLDLGGFDLSGASFDFAEICLPEQTPEVCMIVTGSVVKDANFAGVDFSDAPRGYLLGVSEGSMPSRKGLEGVNFSGAIVSNLDFIDANLRNAIFDGAGLCTGDTPAICANFAGAFLNGATFRGIDFSILDPAIASGIFQDADDVGGIDFTQSNLSGLDLSGLPLTASVWDATIVAGTDFTGTTLSGASFIGVDFAQLPTDFFAIVNPDLTGVDFTDASIVGIDLSGLGLDLEGADLTRTNLSGSTLDDSLSGPTPEDGAVFASTFLDGIDFTNLDSNFFQNVRQNDDEDQSRPSVANSNFSNANLTGMNFDGVDMRSTNLTGAVLADASLRCDVNPDTTCTDLTGALVSGTDFTGADLTGAILDDLAVANPCVNASDPSTCVDFTDAILERVSMQRVDARNMPPKTFQGISSVGFSNANLDGSFFGGLDLRGINFTGMTAPGSFELFCTLPLAPLDPPTCANLDEVDFTGVDLRDTILDSAPRAGTDFSDADLRNAFMGRLTQPCTAGGKCVKLDRAQLQGAEFIESDFTAVTDLFQAGHDCQNDGLRNLRFSSFVLAEAPGLDLSCMDLDGAALAGANFADAVFNGARITDVETQGSGLPPFCVEDNFLQICTDFARADFTNAELPLIDFSSIPLHHVNFSGANLTSATLDRMTDVCAAGETDCITFDDDTQLQFSSMRAVDFRQLAIGFTNRNLQATNLSDSIFSGLDDLVNVDFSFSNLSRTDLSNADLSGSNFDLADFAVNATASFGICRPTGVSPIKVDLRGAILSGADFSHAVHFQNGCVEVDATTIYSMDTKFPVDFDLKDELSPASKFVASMTLPEPGIELLHGASLLAIAFLARARRRRAIS